jgi:hypothetical protein
MNKFYLVMVIFTFDKTISPLPDFLKRVMDRMVGLGGPNDSAEEKEVARWIREVGSFELYDIRKPLPLSITEGREVYCTKTYAQKHLLPGGQVLLPYIFVTALPDMPDVAADMAPYPSSSERRIEDRGSRLEDRR